MKGQRSGAPAILAMAAVLVVAVSAYLAGYICLGTVFEPDGSDWSGSGWVTRTYRRTWMPSFFYPAGWIEAKLFRREVHLEWETDNDFSTGNAIYP
jgi:hypothetical protein